jgi:hypothetical protein
MTPRTRFTKINVKVLLWFDLALKHVLWTLVLPVPVLRSKLGHHSPPNEIPSSLHRRDDRALRHESLPQQIESFVDLVELAIHFG